MVNDIKLLHWDTCYTFALKYIGIFEKYKDIDIVDFIKFFELDYNLEQFNSLDLIVFQKIKSNHKSIANEICQNLLIENYTFIATDYHFLVAIDSEFIIDCSFKGNENKDYYIRIRKIKDLNFNSKDYYVYKLKYK